MKPPSLKRQRELAADATTIRTLYAKACAQWGQEKVDADLTRLWDLRCAYGVQGLLPFGTGLVSQNLGEVLWVATAVCGYVQTPWTPKNARRVR
jgi:hypothetical protein